MDPYRLPRHVVPTRYDLRLEPDLAAATFRGAVTITLTVQEATREIVLNAIELAIDSAVLTDPAEKDSYPAAVTLDEATERCRLTLPAPVSPGTWLLRLGFRGTLNDKLRGFYRSQYKDTTGTTHVLAAT